MRKLIDKPQVQVPYCGAPYLLDWASRCAVITRSEGWVFDVWDLPAFQITSGPKPRGPKIPPELYKDLDEKAKYEDAWGKMALRMEFGKRILQWCAETGQQPR